MTSPLESVVSLIRSPFDSLAARPRRAALALIALCLAVYLPGVIRLPPVDRTEVIYAETTRDMVTRGNWLDPRYGDTIHQFRPIGTYWAQGVAATLAGPAHARDITVYRLPGLIAVTLSVLALFWLTSPLIGATQALIASVLFSVAPLTVLLSQLAIAEGLALLPAVVAMLALLRIYCATDAEDTTRLASMFWFAIGASVLFNALQLPILIAATLIAIYVMDRDAWWWQRLRLPLGLPIALAIASPWLIVRAYQDGVPFSGMHFKNILAALGGSQDMKHAAWPGTFILATLLGFLPGTALIAPALTKLWRGRDVKIARFLIAWVFGYLVYLELISSKPGTYAVQVLFPALAMAVAMLVTDGRNATPRPHLIPWPPLAASLPLALFAGVYWFGGAWPSIVVAILAAAVAALFFWSAAEGRAGSLTRWAAYGIAALGLFAITLLGGVLPGIDNIWPARQIARFASGCDPETKIGLLGFREPTARFVLGGISTAQSPDALAIIRPDVQIVERRWLNRYKEALAANGDTPGARYGCIAAFNAMRGCPLAFEILATGEADRCFKLPPTSCDAALAPGNAANDCD